MLSAEELQELKQYMKVDPLADDDELITELYDTACGYVKNAGIERHSDDGDPIWVTIVRGLTLYFYDHRDNIEDAIKTEDFSPGLRLLINQRKFIDGAI